MLTSVAMYPQYASLPFLYPYDILLIALSVFSLQALVSICETELVNVDMSIIVNLVHDLRLNVNILNSNGLINVCILVPFVSGRQFRCSFDNYVCVISLCFQQGC